MEGKSALHGVSAWAAHNQLVLGQVATDQKSNEITAIPELLGMLDLSGATVTMDAMGCQKRTAEAIVDAKADYVLTLKDNQPTLHQEVRAFFESAQADGFRDTRHDEHETVDGEQGRIETRRVVASDDIEWMTDRPLWRGLRSVVMIESTRTMGEKSSFERRYYLTSLAPDAAVIGERIRGHWGIENGLHWVLDMAFDEDRCRIRRGHGPDNFAFLREARGESIEGREELQTGHRR